MNIGPELNELTSYTKIEVKPDGRTIIYTEDPVRVKRQLENYEKGISKKYIIVLD